MFKLLSFFSYILTQAGLICCLLNSSEVKQTKMNCIEVTEEQFVALGHQLSCSVLGLVLPPCSAQKSLICRWIYSTFIQVSTWQSSVFRPRLCRLSSLLLLHFFLHLRKASKYLSLAHLQQVSWTRLPKFFPSAYTVFHIHLPTKWLEEALDDSNTGLKCSEHPHLPTAPST